MKVLRFIYALIKYIFIGGSVSTQLYNDRILLCNSCEYMSNDKCSLCGCYVKKKAKWTTEHCPKNKW